MKWTQSLPRHCQSATTALPQRGQSCIMCMTLGSNMKGETWRRGKGRGEGPDVRTPTATPPNPHPHPLPSGPYPAARTDGRRRNAPLKHEWSDAPEVRGWRFLFFFMNGGGGDKGSFASRDVTATQRKHAQQQQRRRRPLDPLSSAPTAHTEPLNWRYFRPPNKQTRTYTNKLDSVNGLIRVRARELLH